MYPDEELLPISALQHLLFCERQCPLIHVERQWAESRSTVEGRQLHRQAHDDRGGWIDGVFVARGLRLHSRRLGLFGQADVVEFVPPAGYVDPAAAESPRSKSQRARELAAKLVAGALSGGWTIRPVEYKRGRPKRNDCDRVQLCAQALCLEEMLGVAIPRGHLYYGQKRRRVDAAFDEALRGTTLAAIARLREIVEQGITPPAVREKKCDHCSLLSICLPDVFRTSSAAAFLSAELARQTKSTGPTTDRFDFLDVVP